MMTLSSITLENYKKYQRFTLEFEEGLTGIIGRNGSGKSTIFDAIIFALYGEVRGQKENLKCAKADEKENVSVALEFEIDARRYKVVRELRGKSQVAKAYLYDDDDALLSEGVKEVTKRVSQIVGMSRDAFMHTVFASQKELTALSGLKNEDRKKIIRKLLGLEKIDKIEIEIRSMLTDLNRDIKSFSEILLTESAKKEILDQQEGLTRSLEEQSREVALIAKQYEAKQKELALLTKELEQLQKQKDEYRGLQSELTLLTQNKTHQTQNLSVATAKLQRLNSLSAQYEKEKPLIAEYKALEEKIKTFQAQKEKILVREGLEKEQVVLREQYKQFQSEIKELEAKLQTKPELLLKEQGLKVQHGALQEELEQIQLQEQTLRSEISKLQGAVAEIEKKVANIQRMGRGSVCPTCTRPLLDEYDNVINALRSEINGSYAIQINRHKDELKTVLATKQKLSDEKSVIEKSANETATALKILLSDEQSLLKKNEAFKGVTEKGKANNEALEALKAAFYDEKAHKEAELSQQGLEAKYRELIGTESVIKEIPTLQDEVRKTEALIKENDVQIKEKEAVIKSHVYDEKLHMTKAKRSEEEQLIREAINKSLREGEKIVENIKGDIKTLQSRIDTDTRQRTQLQAKLDDKNDYEKLKLFMGEFKNKINAKISPRISQLASEMYATITKGRYQHIEVSNEFDFFIYDEGERYPIERFSGGEVDLANLVLRIAISKTLSELSGSGGVGFLAFDEVFGSQDEERRLEIMEAFHTIKEQYRQIFLISHESEIKEMFERVVEL
ncbi:SMC family ATPase [Sulfurimonas sp. HSL3-7]|uniref:SMC family ATPase n=1 Tax=Sulfonitrofixus jiaomeiensis TaxID=3131938 RepID=UPI0031F759E9